MYFRGNKLSEQGKYTLCGSPAGCECVEVSDFVQVPPKALLVLTDTGRIIGSSVMRRTSLVISGILIVLVITGESLRRDSYRDEDTPQLLGLYRPLVRQARGDCYWDCEETYSAIKPRCIRRCSRTRRRPDDVTDRTWMTSPVKRWQYTDRLQVCIQKNCSGKRGTMYYRCVYMRCFKQRT